MNDQPSIFDDVELEWEGVSKKIAATRVLGAIAVVEEVVTLAELSEQSRRKKVKLSDISRAYGAVLRYAGFEVSNEDVYASLFEEDSAKTAQRAVHALLMMMVPRNIRVSAGRTPKGNSETTEASS